MPAPRAAPPPPSLSPGVGRTGRQAIRPLALALLVGAGCAEAVPMSGGPSRETIERHLDREVRVFGHYAAVRLPIREGVQVWNPAYLARDPDGVMYVANLTGEIYSLHDTDGDGLEDTARLFHDLKAEGVRGPSGLQFRGPELYVGTSRGVRIYADTDGDGLADTGRWLLEGVPDSEHPYEWTSALTFGPDDYLYLAVTTDSWNAGASADPRGWRGSLLRISPDGREVERFATGVRSVHGMAFNAHGDLFFADNEGGQNPTEELNLARRGHFYGHNPAKFGDPPATAPLLDLRAEVAPAGIAFNPAGNDFDGTAGDLFVAFYGPGERWSRGAISRVRLERRPDGAYLASEHPVAAGIAKIADLAFGPTGDLYVAQVGRTDYWYQPLEEPDGAIYRLLPAPWIEPSPADAAPGGERGAVAADVLERGRQLFAERACSACHAVDGATELLGPNLREVGRIYDRAELLEEILHPSRRIKPSMAATRIRKRDGETLLGRVVGADERRVRLMIVGNRVVEVPRAEIAAEEPVMQSLMYENLLANVPQEEVDALLDYLIGLHRGADAPGVPR
jgi:putative heme-binding domain-containing protein